MPFPSKPISAAADRFNFRWKLYRAPADDLCGYLGGKPEVEKRSANALTMGTENRPIDAQPAQASESKPRALSTQFSSTVVK